MIGQLRVGQWLTVLYGRQEYEGVIWVEVMDEEGRIGWLPEIYLLPSDTNSLTGHLSPSRTLDSVIQSPWMYRRNFMEHRSNKTFYPNTRARLFYHVLVLAVYSPT